MRAEQIKTIVGVGGLQGNEERAIIVIRGGKMHPVLYYARRMDEEEEEVGGLGNGRFTIYSRMLVLHFR